MNKRVVDILDTTNSTITAETFDDLNQLTLSRQGPYGWPMWKQTRVGQSTLGNYLRNNNTYALPTITLDTGEKMPVLGPKPQGYSWPDNIDVIAGTRSPIVDNFIVKASPVSSNRLPLGLGLNVFDPATQLPVGARLVENITFNNKLGTFPKKELADAVHKEKPFDEQINIDWGISKQNAVLSEKDFNAMSFIDYNKDPKFLYKEENKNV